MRGGERLFECVFVLCGNLHFAKRHVHVVFCDEDDAALGGELCLEAVAVIEIAVVLDGNILVGGDALITFGFGFGGASHRVQDVPACCPKLAAQDELVEIVRLLGQLNREVYMGERIFVLLRRMLDFAEALQGEDLFFDILAVSLVDVLIENGAEKLPRLLCFVDFLHGKKMAEPCARVPVAEAARKKRLGRLPLAREHKGDERIKILFCHG